MGKETSWQKTSDWALLTDLYELTMAECYYQQKMFAPATFSLFIRQYPTHRGYFVSAGLEDTLDFLESFHFGQEDLDYLSETGFFSEGFLHYLSGMRFTGDVHAIAEGRIFFKDEPVVEVTAPLIEAQLIETFVINTINLQVTLATKAARCMHAARGRTLVDFSLRRTQGIDAGLKIARTSYIVGFSATSNILAGKLHGIPIAGTMAHSFVVSFDEEIDSFRAFAETFPENTVLLIDTYDTLSGARKAAIVGKEMKAKGKRLKGIRLDSGDMATLSKQVRTILDEEGLDDVLIFASGGFDEYKIDEYLRKGAEIDAFGVGTKMGVSADAPYTDIAYKLVKYNGQPVLKLSTDKKTLVDQKQVYRITRDKIVKDIIAIRDEELPNEKILTLVMKNGKRKWPRESLSIIRDRFREEFASLDDEYKALENPPAFPVELSSSLKQLQKRVTQEVIEKELGES